MLDIRRIVADREAVARGLANRNATVDLGPIVALDDRRKALQAERDQLKFEQRTLSEGFKGKGKPADEVAALRDKVRALGDRVAAIEEESRQVEEELSAALMVLPNVPHASTPVGADESANVVVRTWGQKPDMPFAPKEHDDLGRDLGILDMKRGANVAGARFAFLTGAGATLERALSAFMLDVHTRHHGYTEVLPPFLVNEQSMTGTGQLPKFREELFVTQDELFLIPTAEVPVTNLHRDEILDEDILPVKYAAYSSCFRREAGSYGRDTRGIIRVHQFQKVELVKFTHPERSYDELEKLVADAEDILQRLGLHYRVMALSTGDIGFSAAKCYDLEVWLPGQGAYREISSCSCFEDFQARRMNVRYRDKTTKKPALLHTLNGSGLAVGRTLVAVLENYQQADGSVVVPEALRPYMGGLERIVARS
jgi:seryl-tRNA synthetase